MSTQKFYRYSGFLLLYLAWLVLGYWLWSTPAGQEQALSAV